MEVYTRLEWPDAALEPSRKSSMIPGLGKMFRVMGGVDHAATHQHGPQRPESFGQGAQTVVAGAVEVLVMVWGIPRKMRTSFERSLKCDGMNS
jgi:hypothetical protein